MLGLRLYKLTETAVPPFIKIALVAGALATGFFAGDIYQWYQSQQTKISLDDYCLLSTQPCTQNDIRIVLDRDISQPLIPTQMTVYWPTTDSEQLFLTLKGYEMEMGTAIFKLVKNDAGQFSGEIMLPVCTLEAMTWVGELSDGTQTMNAALRMER